MAFTFALSAVLRLRESLERREYLALQAFHAQVAEVRSDIKALEQTLVQARIQRANQLRDGLSAAHLQLELAGETRIEQKRQNLFAKLADLQNKVKEQIGKYQRARRERETLEALRRKQLEVYTRERATREQHANDELFLLRRLHGK